MAEGRFNYVAVDPSGRRIRGVVSARDDASAFEDLKRGGLSPIRLKAVSGGPKETRRAPLRPREAAEFLSSLAELLNAGADIRTALSILGARFEREAVRRLCEQLAADVGGGEPLDVAFGRGFDQKQSFVAPMVAAGEAAGDLSGGLQRAADVITSRLKLRDQLFSVLAYPSFVLTSAIGALFVILLFIVPSIAPLAQELGSTPPPSMMIMLAASTFLRTNAALLAVIAASSVVALLVAGRLGMLSRPLEAVFLDGPVRRTAGCLVFGAFANSLGTMVAAGAPISDALRLAIRSVPYKGVRRRLDPVVQAVRQGEYLSNALAEVRGFPPAIIRLAAVGEASNTVGPLLVRSGRMEEETALRRIETVGKIAGPALIVLLGAFLGLLMGGLLSSVSQIGNTALQ